MALLVEQKLGHNPFSGALYAFTNRQRNKIKCVMWEDNDGDVLITTACMSSNMLIHAQHGHTVKTCRVIKKQAPSFVDNGVIGSVPGNVKMTRNTGDR